MTAGTDELAEDPAPHYVLRLLNALDAQPQRQAVCWRDSWLTAADLSLAVRTAWAGLTDLGVRNGTTVAVLVTTNHPASLVARYALHLAGATVVYIRSVNPRIESGPLPLEVQAAMLAETGADIIVTDEANAARAGALAAQADVPTRIALLHSDFSVQQPVETAQGLHPTDAAAWAPSAPALIAFTSGSTRRPKGLIQSFAVWDALVRGYRPRDADDRQPVTLLVTTPVHHTVGCMVDSVLIGSGRVVLHTGFQANRVLSVIASEQVTDLYLPTPHLYLLTDLARRHRTDLRSLRGVIYSGTPASPRRVREALCVFGSAMVQLYGSTETGGISALTELDHTEDELLETVGRPFPWVDVRVLGAESNDELARGSVGEIAVRSRTAMDTYLDPAEPSRLDGWLRTGDLGHWDSYGYLKLVGRLGHVIKTGGVKVYPASVERTLMSHPQVAQAVVFPVEDAERVEMVHAAVVLRPTASCAESDLVAHVTQALTEHHAPRHITFLKSLPVNEFGKPDRARLGAAALLPTSSERGRTP